MVKKVIAGMIMVLLCCGNACAQEVQEMLDAVEDFSIALQSGGDAAIQDAWKKIDQDPQLVAFIRRELLNNFYAYQFKKIAVELGKLDGLKEKVAKAPSPEIRAAVLPAPIVFQRLKPIPNQDVVRFSTLQKPIPNRIRVLTSPNKVLVDNRVLALTYPNQKWTTNQEFIRLRLRELFGE